MKKDASRTSELDGESESTQDVDEDVSAPKRVTTVDKKNKIAID